MPNTTFAEHPLHPQLITFPLALLPTSLALDLTYAVSRRASHADAAFYTLNGALLGGAAAAAAGLPDYLAIPSGTPAKRVANLHAGINLAILGVAGASALLRRTDRRSRAAIALSAIANTAALISAWYGGHLVYEHGVRVKGMSPTEEVAEAKLPNDAAITEPLKRLTEYVPDVGPTLSAPPAGPDGRTPEAAASPGRPRPVPVT